MTDTTPITAEEARNLCGLDHDQMVAQAYAAIREAAANGLKKITLKKPSKEWGHGAYDNTPLWQSVKDTLEKHGYSVSMFYDECSFAVDIGTTISWEKKND